MPSPDIGHNVDAADANPGDVGAESQGSGNPYTCTTDEDCKGLLGLDFRYCVWFIDEPRVPPRQAEDGERESDWAYLQCAVCRKDEGDCPPGTFCDMHGFKCSPVANASQDGGLTADGGAELDSGGTEYDAGM